jgi:orotate phosphoribosyltransferase
MIDTNKISIEFPTDEEAIEYCKENGIPYNDIHYIVDRVFVETEESNLTEKRNNKKFEVQFLTSINTLGVIYVYAENEDKAIQIAKDKWQDEITVILAITECEGE